MIFPMKGAGKVLGTQILDKHKPMSLWSFVASHIPLNPFSTLSPNKQIGNQTCNSP